MQHVTCNFLSSFILNTAPKFSLCLYFIVRFLLLSTFISPYLEVNIVLSLHYIYNISFITSQTLIINTKI